jgi:acetoin utilization protein AcuB
MDTTVREWMTADPVTIGEEDLLELARERMERGRFRRLPVVDRDGRVVGIVTDGDLRQQHGYLVVTRVRAAMATNPITVAPHDPIGSAVDLMLTWKVGGLPVVDPDGRAVGIVTETDLLRGLVDGPATRDDASPRIDVQCTAPTQTLTEAVGVIEAGGDAVCGVDVRERDERTGAKLFRFRLADGTDVRALAAALREHGYAVRGIHPARAAA